MQACATFRFFRRLGDTVYSQQPSIIEDGDMDLENQSPDIVAFRDVMLHFKRFTLTFSPQFPAGSGECVRGRLQWDGGYPARPSPVLVVPRLAWPVQRALLTLFS